MSTTGIVLNKRGEEIKGFTDKCGYKQVSIYSDGNQKMVLSHRLILETFNPIRNLDSLDVNHINGIKTDNRINNLEWCTRSENIIHSYKNYLQNNVTNQYGNYFIISDKDIEYIKNNFWRAMLTQEAISNYFELTRSQVQGVLLYDRNTKYAEMIKYLWNRRATYKKLGIEINKCDRSIRHIKQKIEKNGEYNYEIYEHISDELRERFSWIKESA